MKWTSVRKWLSEIIVCSLLVSGAALYYQGRTGGGVLKTESVQAAAVDYYLKIEGIEGSSTDPDHLNQIEISSFSWGATQPGITSTVATIGAGGIAGRPSVNDFQLTMDASKATPKLMLAAASGQRITEATLFVRKPDKRSQEFLRYKLTEVLITSYQASGNVGDLPVDKITLHFSKIELEYSPLGQSSVKAGWDFRKNGGL